MLSRADLDHSGCRNRTVLQFVLLLLLAVQALTAESPAPLPRRLILAIDGISYRDMKALQEGVTYKNIRGRQFHRQAFNHGYFPVSRLVSTFPSTSDVAWTEIFGNHPLPGYQRTYFSYAANWEIYENALATSMPYEKQMHWRIEGSLAHGRDYVFPQTAFKHEVHLLLDSFLSDRSGADNFYAFIGSTDGAQHLSGDILAMLCRLDEKLDELRARYRAREGRELEILLLSDHGNNHAGAGKRVEVRACLKNAGYRITESIRNPKDVVLPTAGIESWVEIHNSPAETESLLQILSRLPGADVLTARAPGQANRFLVANSNGERAVIEWNPTKNSFRYAPETGDPLGYRPVVEALRSQNQLDAAGFATADAWAAQTLSHHYPLALERIARGHTQVTLNPATILISLKNEYVHAGWLIKKGSEFVTFGGTHGALDDLNSTGMLLSSFAPTRDTSSSRLAGLYEGFAGRRDYRAQETGAEWVSGKLRALAPGTLAQPPSDQDCTGLPDNEVSLRIWTPGFTSPGTEAPVAITVRRIPRFLNARIRQGEPQPADAEEHDLVLNHPIALPQAPAYERVFGLPLDLILAPQQVYCITGRIHDPNNPARIFKIGFRTNDRGLPVAY